MPLYEILPGLPPYGARALAFSATGQGRHREGFVVRFFPSDGESWVGNFQPGLSDLDSILDHPDGKRVLVISGGQAYVIDPDAPSRWTHFGGGITFVTRVDVMRALLIGNGLWFELLGAQSMIWRSRRISWDGMRDIRVHDLRLTGESWNPNDFWVPFTLNLVDGSVIGGSYPESLA